MKKSNILVVDDDAGTRTMLEDLFVEEGYNVITTSSATEGLKMIEKDLQYFHVVVTDIMMPDINGVEFLKKIKERTLTIEVIVITGYSTMKLAVECIEEGAFNYLEKPFGQVDTILKNVRLAIDLQRHKMESILKAYQTIKNRGENR